MKPLLHTASMRPLCFALALTLLGLSGCSGNLPTIEPRETGLLPARWFAPDGRDMEVPFSFETENSKAGVLVTTLGKGGEHFRGRYVRVEQSTKGEWVTEVYDGWSGPEWEVWRRDADGQWTETAKTFGAFADFYTGKVVATLSGSENHAMRCRFTLKDPQGGWLHGGTGECQISDGSRVELDF